MRIYLPATVADLSRSELDPRSAHGVTARLRAEHPRDGEEDLEVVAFLLAADASLAQLRASDMPARVVVAADVDAARIRLPDDVDPTAVEVTGPVPWAEVVSIHVDDPADAETAEVIREAVSGRPGADEVVAEADLLWFDISERQTLQRLFGH